MNIQSPSGLWRLKIKRVRKFWWDSGPAGNRHKISYHSWFYFWNTRSIWCKNKLAYFTVTSLSHTWHQCVIKFHSIFVRASNFLKSMALLATRLFSTKFFPCLLHLLEVEIMKSLFTFNLQHRYYYLICNAPFLFKIINHNSLLALLFPNEFTYLQTNVLCIFFFRRL